MRGQATTKTAGRSDAPARCELAPGRPGYRVGDDGSIRSRVKAGRYGGLGDTWRRIKPFPWSRGYLFVRFGRKYGAFVRRLVLEAFVGPCPGGMEACHDPDPTPSNCRLDNLRWDTHKGNYADSVRHGSAFLGGKVPRCGERNPAAKLTEDVVRAIMEERAGHGRGAKAIALALGLPASMRGAVDAIIRGSSWNHVTGLPPYRKKSNRPARPGREPVSVAA